MAGRQTECGNRIITDPAVMGGRPVIAGTRITVECILQHFLEGMSEEELLKEYPQLTCEDVRAVRGIGRKP